MNVRYFFGSLISIPLLPLMYYQGKRIRAMVPRLPEAKGTEGAFETELKADKHLSILTIGESTMAGVGVKTHEEGFSGTFAKELSTILGVCVSWKVYARSGYTAKKMAQRLVPKIVEDKFNLIVIGLGGNDAFTLNTPKQWKKDVHHLILSLQSQFPDAVIVFCNMPPIKEFPAFTPLIRFIIGNLVEILGIELKTLVSKFDNVYYFDEQITLAQWIKNFKLTVEKRDFFSDGVHPSKLTYQTWAKDIAKNVANHKKIRSLLLQPS